MSRGGSLEGRQNVTLDQAGARPGGDGGELIELTSPRVGAWRPRIVPGHVVVGGDVLGEIEVLGQAIRVVAPASARGAVVMSAGAGRAYTAVAFGQVLYRLDPSAGAAASATEAAAAAAGASGLVFAAPTSGRFYSKSGPGKAPFVAAGDVVAEGQTLFLLEVMKTFNRVTYGGPGLPPRARVTRILVADEADVAQGDAILALEDAGAA
jgi:acetyl-CoA carboxylase biotin carboxyl carrier protein